MAVKTLENVTVSDAYLSLMTDRGVEYLFANAGTDFAPMIEARARAQALRLPHPKPVTCPHENTAQHMAIGSYLATGRPQLTMHHVNVDLSIACASDLGLRMLHDAMAEPAKSNVARIANAAR